MDLIETLRSTGAVRDFLPDPIDDAVLYRILDTARFAPSGGNRQGWRVIVVKDPEKRRALRDLYLTGWYEYLAMSGAGLVPWAPVTDRVAEAEVASAPRTGGAGGGPDRRRVARHGRGARPRTGGAAPGGRPDRIGRG